MTSRERLIDLFSSMLIWLAAFFAPALSSVFTIGVFVFADLITGVVAAKKRYHSITSRKLKRTIYKFIAYGVAIIISLVVEKQFLSDFPAMKLITGFIAYIELKSLNENIEIITGVNLFKSVLEKFTPPDSPKK